MLTNIFFERIIFSDIEIIHNFNAELLKELEPIVLNWSPRQCLGNIFLKIVRSSEYNFCQFLFQMDFMKIYSNYIQNFNNALDMLHQCKSKKGNFEKFLQECRDNDEVNHLDLASYLIMPG
jgi:hypothetical protein